MNDTENILTPRGPFVAAFQGPRDVSYSLMVWAFVLASLAHLWLLDAASPDWMTSNIIYVLGLVILIIGRGAAGWIICTVALAIPLLFHRDQLTQSVLLIFYGFAGVAACLLEYFGQRGIKMMRVSLKGLTILTYGFAALHKLNRDFFEPSTSCANYGLDELFVYFGFSDFMFPAALNQMVPAAAVVWEASIALFYLLGRRRLAWFFAAAFHIPITLTMAPAFAFVMLVGHVAFVEAADREALTSQMKRSWRFIIPTSVFITAFSLWLHGKWPEITMIPKEWSLWLALITIVVTFRRPKDLLAKDSREFSDLKMERLIPVSLASAFFLNCMTPYTGLQYQHAAAMLSNLRIDEGCWNSYLFPESFRLTEDYIRVEHAYFGAPGELEEYEQILLEQLWNPPQMLQMRRNWCKPELRPIYIRGTYRDRTFEIQDVCEDKPLPFPDDGIFGVEVFPNYLRYQKNLMRECPQTCIH